MTRAGAAVVALVMLAVGCGITRQTALPPINVTGTVAWVPAHPTCPSGEPCDPPNSASVVIFSRSGAPDVVIHLDPSGAFALHLDPGRYSIGVGPPIRSGRILPDQVRVPATGTVQLRLSIVLTSS